MAVFCVKCGKEVDTLAKRRHRCKRISEQTVKSTTQQILISTEVWSAERCINALNALKSYSNSHKD